MGQAAGARGEGAWQARGSTYRRKAGTSITAGEAWPREARSAQATGTGAKVGGPASKLLTLGDKPERLRQKRRVEHRRSGTDRRRVSERAAVGEEDGVNLRRQSVGKV